MSLDTTDSPTSYQVKLQESPLCKDNFIEKGNIFGFGFKIGKGRNRVSVPFEMEPIMYFRKWAK